MTIGLRALSIVATLASPKSLCHPRERFGFVSDGLLFLVHPMAHLGMLGGWVGGKRNGLYRAATDDGYFIAVPRYEGGQAAQISGVMNANAYA